MSKRSACYLPFYSRLKYSGVPHLTLLLVFSFVFTQSCARMLSRNSPRRRVSINEGWRFMKYEAGQKTDDLIYDARPNPRANRGGKPASAESKEPAAAGTQTALKPWILPTGNAFIKDPAARYVRPAGNPGGDFEFVKADFDDSSWTPVVLPHDWAIEGPFMEGWNASVGGGMGRLPSPGVAWYRKQLNIPASDAGKSFFLDWEEVGRGRCEDHLGAGPP